MDMMGFSTCRVAVGGERDVVVLLPLRWILVCDLPFFRSFLDLFASRVMSEMC